MVKVLTIFFLITLQLALQIGVPIHKHFCDMDGAFASVLVKVDHQCAEPHTDLPPCCQKEKTKKPHQGEPPPPNKKPKKILPADNALATTKTRYKFKGNGGA